MGQVVDCVEQLEAETVRIKHGNPNLSDDEAFYAAVRNLPEVAALYNWCHEVRGVAHLYSLPLRRRR